MSLVIQAVLLEKPHVLYVDQDYSIKPPAYGTIDKLMQSLHESGPIVALGKMGPDAHKEAPLKLKDRVHNQEIYGWRPGTSKEGAASRVVILLGARKVESQGHVYFTLATDITKDRGFSLVRGYIPSETDEKVYIISYQNFLERALVDLHPIFPHADRLFSLPVNGILDRGEIEKECKQIGQQIFDHYKRVAHGDSERGKSAVQRICEAARVLTNDGTVRKAHIESAWDGVGDMTWQWRA